MFIRKLRVGVFVQFFHGKSIYVTTSILKQCFLISYKMFDLHQIVHQLESFTVTEYIGQWQLESVSWLYASWHIWPYRHESDKTLQRLLPWTTLTIFALYKSKA